MKERPLHVISFPSGIAAPRQGCAQGPIVLKNSTYLADLSKQGVTLQWDAILKPQFDSSKTVLETVNENCKMLAETVAKISKCQDLFLVFAGDHSSAIGTWSGAHDALSSRGQLGLIWVDAHMDSHTDETSETGNIHGMPLASLLGQGNPALTQILSAHPKLAPENVCVIGARSFEKGESQLLNKLKVRVFYMDEIEERGMHAVMQDAIKIVSKNTAGFGLTLDVDSVDPEEAPGTGVPEPNGIKGAKLCEALTLLINEPTFMGAEIVEFDPSLDVDHKTEKLIAEFVKAIAIGS
jgi:arginase